MDTHGNKGQDGIGFKEQYFVSYIQDFKKYNQVNEGDIFIYRRPQSSSEIKGEFYFVVSRKAENDKYLNQELFAYEGEK